MRITADAAGGSVRITFLDADNKPLAVSEPINDEVTDRLVDLPKDVIAACTGKAVRLRVEMTRAKVDSFALGD